LKKKLYEAGTEVIKVIGIYVNLMVLLYAVGTGLAQPELGTGLLVVATFLNIMFNIARKGRGPWKKRQ